MQTKKLRPVYLEWEDHWSPSGGGWHDLEEGPPWKPLICCSVGWIVKEDSKGVVLAANISGGGDLSQCSYILKNCIKRRRRLQP